MRNEETSKISPQYDGVTAKLSVFVKEAGSKKMAAKDGETMEPQNALWYIEGAVNYMNAHEGFNYLEVATDSMEFTLTADADGNINKAQIFEAYYDVYSFSQYFFGDVDAEDKYVLVLDVEEKAVENNLHTYKATCLVASGMDNNEKASANNPFTKDWWWGDNYGDCSGNDAPHDAASLLQQKLTNHFKPTGFKPYYYTDIDSSSATYSEYVNGGNIVDSYLFRRKGTATTINGCIAKDHLNFYFTKQKEEVIPNEITRKAFIFCRMDEYPTPIGNLLQLDHVLVIYHGNYHIGYPTE